MSTLRVLRHAIAAGYADYTTIYTWRSWLVGWYVRVLAQVSFFALLGQLIGSDERTRFLLVGNAMLLAGSGTLLAVASTAWERWAGTLPLLVASPTGAVTVFAGRSLFWVPDALLSSLGTFFVAALIFDVSLPWPDALLVIPLAMLIAASTYCLGIFLGGLVLRNMHLRNLVANVTWLSIAAIGGVNVPLSYMPEALRWVAEFLPLTHGLRSVRGVLGDAAASDIVLHALAEAAVGLGWLALALLTFDRLAEGGRAKGTIEFAT